MQIKDTMEKCRQNTYFRQVLATGPKTQLVIMDIKPGEDIGQETHKDNDQLLMMVSGRGKAVLDNQEFEFSTGDVVLVPAGTPHNFINTDSGNLKIVTTYSPPHHPDGTIHKTKADAEDAERKKVAIASAATTAATFQTL